LRKSLYGLKQASKAWNAKFTGYLPAIGFVSSHSDPSLFVKHLGSDIVILLLYVDDIILTGSKVLWCKKFLIIQLEIFLLTRLKYAKDLLAKAGLSSCRSCPTPCKPHGQLLKSDGDALNDPTIYRSISYIFSELRGFTLSSRLGSRLSTRRSITGFVAFLGHNPISWQSKKQNSVSRSSTEAEYRALAHTAADLAWIRQVLLDLK
ncbi:KAR-UP oxidoreductase 1, partial [Prunus dulcis]